MRRYTEAELQKEREDQIRHMHKETEAMKHEKEELHEVGR